MGRWKVERWADPNVAAWVAWDEDAPDRMMLFATHAEALDYADEKARTREVVLPRISRVEEMRLTVWQDQFGVPRVAMNQGRIEYGNLPPGHIAGVGHYLLALAYLVARRQREANDKAVSK